MVVYNNNSNHCILLPWTTIKDRPDTPGLEVSQGRFQLKENAVFYVGKNLLSSFLTRKCLQAGLSAPQDQGVNIMSAFISVDGFQIHQVPDHMVLIRDTVTSMHVP